MKHKLGGKARHHGKHHAAGGEAEVGNPHVFEEAKERSIGTIHGDGAKARMDRKRGGKAHKAHGGKTGSDTHPYTSAHAHGGKAKADGHHEGLHGAHRRHKEHKEHEGHHKG
jgi:hypothetical protein